MPRSSRSRLTRSAEPRLAVLLEGRRAGDVYQMANRRLAFRYDDGWQSMPGAYPLSVAMPLVAKEHGDRAIRNYMWGLMPEDPHVLARWAKQFRVARTDIVGLLAHVGEDCAGAVQLVPPQRAASLQRSSSTSDDSVTWISRDEIGIRLRALALDHAAVRAPRDPGQFSLAGAQPKIALFEDANGKWGVPAGRTPTNRILKPPVLRLDDLAYNEHICLMLARQVGLPAAHSSVQTFGNEFVIVIERYDRLARDGAWGRIHQEDFCQALALPPTRKYETDGGPDAVSMIQTIRDASSDSNVDVQRFIDALAFNWLIAGTDAHAKNYSLLHATGPSARLAPLYDLISFLPYAPTGGTPALAMSIGGEHRVDAIARAHWHALARAGDLGADVVVGGVKRVAHDLRAAISALESHENMDENTKRVVSAMGARIDAHCRSCISRL